MERSGVGLPQQAEGADDLEERRDREAQREEILMVETKGDHGRPPRVRRTGARAGEG
jgi:hypothetical protein